jgi:biotin carboxyl carrier protein
MTAPTRAFVVRHANGLPPGDTRVTVEPRADGVVAFAVGPQKRLARLSRMADGAVRLEPIEPPGPPITLHVSRNSAGIELHHGGWSWILAAQDERETWLQGGGHGGRAKGGRISVSMPGRVVKVLVALGQTVQAGESLLIVEAMKMENEVKATTSGKVTALPVSEGQSVESGQTLIEVEPAGAEA